MNIPSVNRQIFYRIDESMSVRWMRDGMMVTRQNGRKRYYADADWLCIRTRDAHHLGYSIDWGDLAVLVRRTKLREKLDGAWRGSDVRQVGPVQLAKRRRMKASPLFCRYGFEDEL